MTFTELTKEERIQIREMIEKMIGTKEDAVTEDMNRSDRIKARSNYDKMFDKLAKIWIQYGDKALATTYIDQGFRKNGITPSGKAWQFEMNSFGWTDRSHHCGSLYIEGIGCVFTSGTIAKAMERVFEN